MGPRRDHYAKRAFAAAIVGTALSCGVPVHAAKDELLQRAATSCFDAGVDVLLDLGADVHANNNAALRWAAVSGNTLVVERLLGHGADVHAWNDYALRWAAAHGQTDTVKVLLDAGADPAANDHEAIVLAAYSGHRDAVTFSANMDPRFPRRGTSAARRHPRKFAARRSRLSDPPTPFYLSQPERIESMITGTARTNSIPVRNAMAMKVA